MTYVYKDNISKKTLNFGCIKNYICRDFFTDSSTFLNLII
jgi:hypothetical protein